MTQTTSNSMPIGLHRYCQKLKIYIPFMIAFFILNLLGYPALMSMPIIIRDSHLDYWFRNMFLVFPLISGILILGGPAACAWMSFPYLYKKPEADMEYALPVSTRTRFTADFLSGLTACTVPLALSYTVGLIGFKISVALIDTITYIDPYTQEFYHSIFDGAELMGTVLPVSILFIFSGIMMYVISVFAFCTTGDINRAVFVTALLTMAVPMAAFSVISSLFIDFFGIDNSLAFSHVIPYTSPLGGAFFAQVNMFGFNSYLPVHSKVTVPLMMAAVSAVYTAAAYHTYKRRTASESGSKYISPVILFICAAVCSMAATFILCSNGMHIDRSDAEIYRSHYNIVLLNTVIFAVCAALCIISVFVSRHKKRIAAFTAAVMALSVLSYSTVRATNAFDAENRIPDVSEIKGVRINWQDSFSRLYDVPGNKIYECLISPHGIDFKDFAVYTENRDDIAVIADWHRYSVQKHIDYDEYDNNTVTVNYSLMNGTMLTRTYCIDKDGAEILKALDMSDAFRDKRADVFDTYIDEFLIPVEERTTLSELEIYNEKMPDELKKEMDTLVLSSAPIDVHFSDKSFPDKTPEGKQTAFQELGNMVQFDNTETFQTKKRDELPSDFGQKLKKNLRKDIMAETAEQFYGGDDAYVLVFSGAFNKIKIPVHYENTLSYLYECGFDNAEEYRLPEFEEFSSNYTKKCNITDTSMFNNQKYWYSNKDIEANIYKGGLIGWKRSTVVPEERVKKIYDLIRHGKLYKLADDDDFILSFGSYYYVIDDEYRDATKELYIEVTAERIQEYEQSDQQDDETTKHFQEIREKYPEIDTYIQNGGK